MKKILPILLCLLLVGCGLSKPSASLPPTQPPTQAHTTPRTTDPPEPTAPPLTPPEGYTTADVIHWFSEIALAAEVADVEGDAALVKKWDEPVYYMVCGSPTEADRKTLEAFAAEVRQQVPQLQLQETTDLGLANLTIRFCDQDTLLAACPHADPWVNGYVTVWWYNANRQIHQGQIHIRTDISQEKRDPVIQHEFLQALGFLQDSSRKDSILYLGDIQVNAPSPLDWFLLRLLYSPELETGMDEAACNRILNALLEP